MYFKFLYRLKHSTGILGKIELFLTFSLYPSFILFNFEEFSAVPTASVLHKWWVTWSWSLINVSNATNFLMYFHYRHPEWTSCACPNWVVYALYVAHLARAISNPIFIINHWTRPRFYHPAISMNSNDLWYQFKYLHLGCIQPDFT